MRQISSERLWAPWRSGFVSSRKARRCIFCVVRPRGNDRKRYVVARGKKVFSLLNIYPYNNGHIMVAPYRHLRNLEALQPDEWLELFEMSRRLMRRIRHKLSPHGFNIGMNVGKIAGAGFPGHIHLHIVPRWRGDVNFMPVVGNTKVISQSLEELYKLLTARS